MQKTRLDEYLRDPQFDSSALPARTFDMSGLPSNNYGQQNNYYLYTTQFPDQYPTQVPSQVKFITKTRLFKYTENITTKKMKIFR